MGIFQHWHRWSLGEVPMPNHTGPQVKESMGGKACDSPNGSEFREALAIVNPFRKNG